MSATVYSEFCNTAARCPEQAFLHIPSQATAGYAAGPVNYSYGQALASAHALRSLYSHAGYRGGQRVALLLDNRAEFFLHLLALNAQGVSVVPINSALNAKEMAYVIGHSDCALVVSLPDYMATVSAALAIVLAQHGSNIPVLATDQLSTLLQRPPPLTEDATASREEAALLYTSGTTGAPKGCMLSNDYFTSMGDWYLRAGGYCRLDYGQERLLTPLPLVHMNALCCSMMAMIMSGGCLIQLDRFHASSWWQTLRTSRATCLHYLGVMPAILLALPPRADDDCGTQIKFGFGAGVDPKHQAAFEARFGFPLIEAWAMTETGVHVCISAHAEPRHVGQRCIGKPLNAIDYRLVDEQGEDVAAGAPGELLIRAAGAVPQRGFFSGYYKDDAATAAAWEGGYFHTGDVLRCDADGIFYFVDRRKNIIRRSGENIAATEVENIILQHPAVAGCVAAPVYDALRGEEVGLCVLTAAGITVDEQLAAVLFDFCAEYLIYYKLPAYYCFVDSLPMTASQKIRRGEVKKQLAAMVEGGQAIDLRVRKQRPKK